MIKLVKGQSVPGTQYVVIESGDYDDNENVGVATLENPELSVCAFQAYYIATGVNVNESAIEHDFTKFELRNLFTIQELLELDNYKDNPNLTIDQKKVLTTIFADLESVKDEVDVNLPRTQNAFITFAEFGLITQDRLLEIINNV